MSMHPNKFSSDVRASGMLNPTHGTSQFSPYDRQQTDIIYIT